MIWVMFIGTCSQRVCLNGPARLPRPSRASPDDQALPDKSPNKTVEGFRLCHRRRQPSPASARSSLPIVEMAVLGFRISLLATLGDLVESVAKRYTGIKDSGNIIPGHGGVWNRFDSVLFTAPLVYYFVLIAGLGLK